MSSSAAAPISTISSDNGNASDKNGVDNSAVLQQVQATPLERLAVGILESLDGSFANQTSSDSLEQHKSTAMALSSKLLTVPTQLSVDHCNRALLSMLFPTRSAFFNHKVNFLFLSKVESRRHYFKHHKLVLYFV